MAKLFTGFGGMGEAPYITAMTSVLTVANRFLDVAKAKGVSLTPLQLMKLVYMGNGWMLAYTGKPLFDDRIEAWKYGPVIPTLYHQTKGFGSSVITQQLPAPTGDVIDPDAGNLFEVMIDKYGKLSGIALSNLTHRPGSPWSAVWRDGYVHVEIPRDTIRKHYESLKGAPVVHAA